jgi:hypothetical protein
MKLRQQQIDQYFEDGFIIVEDLFTRDELQPEMDELAQRVEDMAQRLYVRPAGISFGTRRS